MGRKKGERPEGPKGKSGAVSESESFPALSASKEDKAKVLVGAWAQRKKRDDEVSTAVCSTREKEEEEEKRVGFSLCLTSLSSLRTLPC